VLTRQKLSGVIFIMAFISLFTAVTCGTIQAGDLDNADFDALAE
jgi:hypothetical protein